MVNIYAYCKACEARVHPDPENPAKYRTCLEPDLHRAKRRHIFCYDVLLGGKKGERIRKRCKEGVTRKDAEIVAYGLVAKFNDGQHIPRDKSKIPASEILDKYYRECLVPKMVRGDNSCVKYYIETLKKLIGSIGIGTISLEQTQTIRAKWQQETESKNSSANRMFNSVLKTVLNRAVEWGYLPRNPLQFLRPLPVEETLPRFLTLEELERVWVQVKKDQRVYNLATAIAHTGLRPIEFKTMNWSQVNFDTRTLTYVTYKGRKPRTCTTPIDNELFILLQRRFKETNGMGKVFDTRYNKHLPASLIDASGINEGRADNERFTLYGFKHCYISHLLMQGAKIDEVSKLVNVSIRTLEKHYIHLTQDHLRTAQSKINLSPAPKLEVI